MIGIPSHFKFLMDDGPKTREDTRALLEESYRQGVWTIIPLLCRVMQVGCLKLPKKKILKIFKKWKIAAEVAPDLTIQYGQRSTLPMIVLKNWKKRSFHV